jgi:hypothetical protein
MKPTTVALATWSERATNEPATRQAKAQLVGLIVGLSLVSEQA